jgi:2-oxoglutarate ferredoxin oxidoreductase subunit beta
MNRLKSLKNRKKLKNRESQESLIPAAIPTLSKRDLESDQDVRWCPGCGDYSILAQTQRIIPDLGIPKEQFVFVSGIGCSSRFPYYMNTYGFHTIHGRAPTIATGIKTTNPDLSVWVITGDGDALSIGGNHFIHMLRRNLNLNVLLFNNQVYGLTKGQYSPTSPLGTMKKSTPDGSIEQPLNPVDIALSAGATFVARSIDRDTKHLQATIKAAHEHKGTSFIEIYQNCNIFNDGAFFTYTEKATRADNTVILEHGEPLIFGAKNDKGIRLNGLQPEVVSLSNEVDDDLIIHDQHSNPLGARLSRDDTVRNNEKQSLASHLG